MSDHGTRTRYTYDRCRCDECTKANADYQRKANAARRERQDAVPHGTTGGYSNWGCRCERCVDVWRASERALYRKRNPEPRKRAQHGDRVMYTRHGCRCDLCKAAAAAYQQSYYKRKRAA